MVLVRQARPQLLAAYRVLASFQAFRDKVAAPAPIRQACRNGRPRGQHCEVGGGVGAGECVGACVPLLRLIDHCAHHSGLFDSIMAAEDKPSVASAQADEDNTNGARVSGTLEETKTLYSSGCLQGQCCWCTSSYRGKILRLSQTLVLRGEDKQCKGFLIGRKPKIRKNTQGKEQKMIVIEQVAVSNSTALNQELNWGSTDVDWNKDAEIIKSLLSQPIKCNE